MPEPPESKSKKHFQVSVVKSIFRIFGCCTVFVVDDVATALSALASMFLAAECLGIVEEL